MSANSTLEIQEFVEQQHGGPIHLTGTDVVLMSVDVYREIMGVGTEAELQASLQGIHAGWKAVQEGRTRPFREALNELGQKYETQR
jgi:hypothetical protein